MTTSLKYAGLGESVSSAPYDDDAWVSPTNIYTDNAAYASVTATSFDTSDYSTILKATTFGFAIPTSPEPASIQGILVEVEKYHANGDVVDAVVQLTLDGTNQLGDNKADTTTHWQDAAAIASYGGATDRWGLNLTASEINATTFGVHFVAQAHSDDADAYVDYIRVTVYYEALGRILEPIPARRSRFKANRTGCASGERSTEWIKSAPVARSVPTVPSVSVATAVT